MVARGEIARFWSLESLHMGMCAVLLGAVLLTPLSELQLTVSLPFPTPLLSVRVYLEGRKGRISLLPGEKLNLGVIE